MVTIIAAVADNYALGKDNQLLWHLPDDFKRFKALTTGHHIIMGRKTFESFPKPLPDRTHIIITRQRDYHVNGCVIAGSLPEALRLVPEGKDTFIIGGGEIYKEALPYTDIVDITRVHATPDADTWFPELPAAEWKLISKEYHAADERHKYAFTFQTYARNKALF